MRQNPRSQNLSAALLLRLTAVVAGAVLAGALISWALARAGSGEAVIRVSAALSSVVLFGLPALLFWRFSGGIKRGVGLYAPRAGAVAAAAGAALALQPTLQLLSHISQDVLRYALSDGAFARLMQAQAVREDSVARIMGDDSWSGLLAVALVLALLPALCEEFFFRGTLQRLVVGAGGRQWLAVGTVSLVFTAVHLDGLNAAGIFLCSFLLGYLYLWTGNIWAPVAFHLTSNLWNVALMYVPAAGAASFPGWSIPLGLVLTAAAMRAIRGRLVSPNDN